MSRAYKIRVSETLKRVVRGQDSVSTCLELLEILPCEEMAELLAVELEQRGYTRNGSTARKNLKGATVTVDLNTGEVTAQAEAQETIEITRDLERRGYDDTAAANETAKKELRAAVRADLKKQASELQADLQSRVTDQLEKELAGLKGELNQAVNRATAEALKRKAAQLGQIKEMTEDPQKGLLTLVIEV